MMQRINLKNKRGGLLSENVVKLVIALISVGLLIWFLVSLYYSQSDLKLAKNILIDSKRSLKNQIIEFWNSDDTERDITLMGKVPSSWQIELFSGEKCSLCACPSRAPGEGSDIIISVGKQYSSEKERCSEKGVCTSLSFSCNYGLSGLEKITKIHLSKQNDKLIISPASHVTEK